MALVSWTIESCIASVILSIITKECYIWLSWFNQFLSQLVNTIIYLFLCASRYEMTITSAIIIESSTVRSAFYVRVSRPRIIYSVHFVAFVKTG